MACALETYGGIRVRTPGRVVALATVTGEQYDEESYRPIRFLPLVAQRERRPLLNALRFFQRNTKHGQHIRYAVITAGQRIPAWADLRGSLGRLHRRISRWAHEATRDWDMEIFHRQTEFTRDQAGTYHPHANVLYRPRRRMTAERWSQFLRWSRSRLGAHWQDNGELRDADEAIKYPFKPAELEAADGEELVWLWWQCHRMKFSQPMGPFAAFCRQLAENRQKVVMVNRPSHARLEIVAKAPHDPVEEPAEPDPAKENQILCRTAPQFRFGPYAQPVTLVVNYTANPTTPQGARRLAIIREWNAQAREWWDANGAPDPAVARAIAAGQAAAQPGQAGRIAAIKVHTSRLTVQTAGVGPPIHILPDGTAFDPATGEVLIRTPPRAA